jgi:predicted transcriptional regulator
MVGHPSSELLSLLAHRGDLIRCINDGIQDKRELAGELDVSRSTINRGLRELEEHGVVRDHSKRYELTLYGQFALQLYRHTERLTDARLLFPNLPCETPFEILPGANVTVAERQAPRRPVKTVGELIESATRVHGVFVAILPTHAESISKRIRNDVLSADFVIGDKTLNHLLTKQADTLQTALQADSCTVWQSNADFSFNLVVADEAAMSLGVYDDRGRLLGTLVNDTETAVAWALDTFQKYRATAETISLQTRTSHADVTDTG